MPYRLLNAFEGLFEGDVYNHRRSNLGDFVAIHLYEDLFSLGKSSLLCERIALGNRTINLANAAVGKKSRRGDGTFGERTPSAEPIKVAGFDVQRAKVANIEIGVETKILAKAMIKQIDRVVSDLIRQVTHFRDTGGNPISVGMVGVNFAPQYVSFEGSRPFSTDGKKYRHPIQEAPEAIKRLRDRVANNFDEFLILKFIATNSTPFGMQWVDLKETEAEYSSALVRISNLYKQRFP